MFSNGEGNAGPDNASIKTTAKSWDGFSPNGIALNDAARAGIKQFFPGVGANDFKGQMLLKPGFEVVKVGMSKEQFKPEIDKVLAGL